MKTRECENQFQVANIQSLYDKVNLFCIEQSNWSIRNDFISLNLKNQKHRHHSRTINLHNLLCAVYPTISWSSTIHSSSLCMLLTTLTLHFSSLNYFLSYIHAYNKPYYIHHDTNKHYLSPSTYTSSQVLTLSIPNFLTFQIRIILIPSFFKMPLPSLSIRSSADNPSTSNPSTPSQPSNQETQKVNLFRRFFTTNSNSSFASYLSPTSSEDSNPSKLPTAHRRFALVPPNYTPIFHSFTPGKIILPTRHQWVESIISFTSDNAIRMLLNDLYSILANMEQRPLMLSIDDIDLFYHWFDIFHGILEQLFHLDESCLFAWVEGADLQSEEQKKWIDPPYKLGGELSEGRRKRRVGEILRMFQTVGDCRSRFPGRPVLQTLPILAKVLHPLIEEIVGYLNMKSNQLPEIVYGKLKQKDSLRFEKDYWTCAFNLLNPGYTVVATVRWMSPRLVRQWKGRCCPKNKRAKFVQWEKAFQEQFADAVGEFKNRVAVAELERENQVKFSRMLRERAIESCDISAIEHEKNDVNIKSESFCSDSDPECNQS